MQRWCGASGRTAAKTSRGRLSSHVTWARFARVCTRSGLPSHASCCCSLFCCRGGCWWGRIARCPSRSQSRAAGELGHTLSCLLCHAWLCLAVHNLHAVLALNAQPAAGQPAGLLIDFCSEAITPRPMWQHWLQTNRTGFLSRPVFKFYTDARLDADALSVCHSQVRGVALHHVSLLPQSLHGSLLWPLVLHP